MTLSPPQSVETAAPPGPPPTAPAAGRHDTAVPDTAALLARAARGEPAALDTLVRRYVDFVYGTALRQTRDAHAAEDVTQAVFLVLARKAAGVRAAALAAWLHRTTCYTAANARRAAARRRRHEAAAARPERVMPDLLPEPNPLLPLLDDAIAKLNERDRIVVVERYLLGRDAPDVAAALGLSSKSAQKVLERAIARLRDRLAAASFRARVAGGVKPRMTRIPATAVVGLLAAAASGAMAAPPNVVSAVATAVAAPAAASAGSAALAKGTLSTLAWAKAKLVAGVAIAATVVGGASVETVRRLAAAPTVATRPTPPAPPPAASPVVPAAARAALRSGVWIEFLGLSENPSDDKPWHGPDGHPLARRPYMRSGTTAASRDGITAREYAFAIDASRVFVIPNTPRSDGDAATLRISRAHSSTDVINYSAAHAFDEVEDRFIRYVDEVVAVIATPRTGAPVTIGFDVAAKPWVPRVVSQPDADTTIISENDVLRTALSRPFEDENDATVWYLPAEFYSRPDVRLVAIDTDGRTHVPQQRSSRYRSPQQRAEEPLLDRELPRLRFDRTPFGEVVRRLEALDIPIVVEWNALAVTNKVTPETPVSATIGSDRLYAALEMLFQWVGDHGEPDFDVKDGVVTIRPPEYRRPKPWPYYVPGVPLTRLARFEVQTRAFDEWVAFGNLTSELGKPSALTIRTSDAAPAVPQAPPSTAPIGGTVVKLAGGSSVELVALGDAATGACWRPDGTPSAVPFGYRPPPDGGVEAGRRRVWAITVTRGPDGRSIEGRTYLRDPETGKTAAGIFSSGTRTAADGTIYQARELVLDTNQATVDWAAGVASRPTLKASIERGPEGWDPAAVGRIALGNGDEALLWRPEDTPPTKTAEAMTRVQAWTPKSVGPDDQVDLDFTLVDGGRGDGLAQGAVGAGGYHVAQCRNRLDLVHRITLRITRYDMTAVFRAVSLHPGRKTSVQAAAR